MQVEVEQAVCKYAQLDKAIKKARASAEAVVIAFNGTDEEYEASIALWRGYQEQVNDLQAAWIRQSSLLTDEMWDAVNAARQARNK